MRLCGYQLPLVENEEYENYSNGRKPYPHQARVFAEWEHHSGFFLTTRTGSGKTATAAFPVFVRGESALFVYPTNALLEDQVESIAQIGRGAGKRILVLDGTEKVEQEKLRNADHLIIVFNGETLEQFRKNVFHVKNNGQAITELLSIRKPMIILTNPDVLFLLSGMRYSDSAKSIGFLQNRMFATLVVDEFHMYAGLELAHLLFLLYYLRELHVFKRLVILSATPSDETKQYVDKVFKPQTVTDRAEGMKIVSFRKVVHSLDVKAQHSDDLVETMLREVEVLYDELKKHPLSDSTTPVPLVIIVNSVIQAMRIEEALVQKLKIPIEEIAPYRGLVNQKERSLEGKRIVIGTSAIEVGVDFDCNWLFFEASHAAAFLQRIGRAGRHREGKALLFADSRVCQSLSQFSEMERSELETWVKASYPVADDMAWFVATKEGMLSSYVLIDKGIREIEGVWYLTDEQKETAVRKLEEIFKRYVAYFEPWMKKGDSYVLQNKFPAKQEEWLQTYAKNHSFRASNYSVDVYSLREKRIGRSTEAGFFSTDLKRVLEQGVGLKFQLKQKNDIGHFRATVDTFGKRRKTKVSVAKTSGILKVCEPIDLSFYNEDRDRVSREHLGSAMIYVSVPKREVTNFLDWRVETWEVEKHDHIAAFGGHALLLKALFDKVQRQKDITNS